MTEVCKLLSAIVTAFFRFLLIKLTSSSSTSYSLSQDPPGEATPAGTAPSRNTNPQQSIDEHWKMFKDSVLQSLELCIPAEDHKPNHPWISQQTWQPIEQRTEAKRQQSTEEEQRLHKAIRACSDKQQRLKDRLAESEATIDAGDRWRWIKRMGSDYKPRTVTLNGPDGKSTSFSKLADTFAKHLAEVQWALPSGEYTGPTHRLTNDSPVNLQSITMDEFSESVKAGGRTASHRRLSNGSRQTAEPRC